MKEYQKVIVDLLIASMNKQNIQFHSDNTIDWNEVVDEAKKHKISSLIYSSIDRSSLKYIDSTSLAKWKEEILKDNLTQLSYINSISKILSNINRQGVEIILLKGLVLRNFYPRPEYRTMSDIDILVKPEDYLIVKKTLVETGFECCNDNNPIHEEFMRLDEPYIEVHWKIINDNYLNRSINHFEEKIWERAIEFDICGIHCKALCNEDFLAHMFLHMTVHAKCSGFGLRQLYDAAVFIKYKNIDWINFINIVSSCGILKFTKGLLKLLHEIFHINVPKHILEKTYISMEEIQLLLNNILASGVYGTSEEINGFEALCKCKTKEQYVNSFVNRIFKLIFPNRLELSYRYKYAQDNMLLLPLAWIHHFMTGIFIKRYGFVNMFKYCKKSFELLNRRKKIIKIFEL